MRLEDVINSTRQVEVTYQGQSLNVQWDAAKLTPVLLDRMAGESVSAMDMVAALVELLVSWDLMDGDEPYPITTESLQVLPAEFLSAILKGITDSLTPPEQNGGSFAER